MSGKKESASVATPVLQQRSSRGIDGAVPDDELLRMRDVSGIMSCSLAQAYRLANDGSIPALRIRGMVRVPRAQLMAWIIKNSSGGSAS